jgi:CMP-N,N'-diacetyllegionaminic acid synthase
MSNSQPLVLAIIPARAGSKGVPGKNKRLLDNTPLIAYAIQTAKQSRYVSDVVVNTDDPDIAPIALHYGVPVKMRDKKLAEDDSPVFPSIVDSLEFMEKQKGIAYDIVMLLQPTSPFRTGSDADQSIELLIQMPEFDGVVSVVKVEDCHPSRMYRMKASMELESLLPEGENKSRQTLEEIYLRNGCFYTARKQAMLKQGSIMVSKKAALLMDEKWHVNIDTEKDFLLAELLVKQWKQHFNLSF